MTLAAWMTVLATVIVGSTGSGGIVYWALNRNSQRAIDKRTETESEKLAAERESTLAEAAERWQKLIDANATAAYTQVDARCKRCESALERVVGALGSVLAAIVPVVEQIAQRTEVDAEVVADLTLTLQAAEREYQRHS